MPKRVVENSVLRLSLSLNRPSTSFVFIPTLVRCGETIGTASHCDGFPKASSTTSATMKFAWWLSPITGRGPTTGPVESKSIHRWKNLGYEVSIDSLQSTFPIP